MVRVQNKQPSKLQSKKPVNNGKGQGGSVQTPVSQKTGGGRRKPAAPEVSSGGVGATCMGCGVLVSEDSKALQCDRCQSGGAWKCVECLGMSESTYEALSEEGSSLKWFCETCEKEVCQRGHNDSGGNSERIDSLLTLMEKLMSKFENVESKLAEKADVGTVQKLEYRMRHLEERLATEEVSGRSGPMSDKELLESVVKEELKTKLEEDDEIQKRKKKHDNLQSPRELE